MNNIYDKNYYKKQSSAYFFTKERQKIFQYHLDILISIKGKIKTILDVGCGFGYFLNLCDKLGIKTYGLEISDCAIGQAKKYTKAKIEKVSDKSSPLGAFAGKKFDVITAFDVIEHLENDEKIFKFIYHKLKKKGIFYGTTPNSRFFLNFLLKEKDPTHINVHKKSYWSNELRKTGFKNIRIKHIFSFGLPPTSILRTKTGLVNIKPIFTPFELLGQEILFMGRK